MIYKFVLISNEVENFMREISIDSESKFIDLNNAILDSVKYSKDGITSFFTCNDDWEKEQEIVLAVMDESKVDMDEDIYLMDDTVISEFIDDEGQKLLYTFDNIANRNFFLELKEIVTGKDLQDAVCSASIGNPPEQYKLEDFSDLIKSTSKSDLGIDDSFYGDEEFDMDELDSESFSDLNFDDDLNNL